MKKTICLLFVAVVSALSLNAQEPPKAAVYIIDGQVVENFDGSQLVGAKIKGYSYDKENDIHVITTSKCKGKGVTNIKTYRVNSSHSISLDGNADTPSKRKEYVQVNQKEMMVVLDGKIVSYKEMLDLSPSVIDSMEIIKDKNHPDFKKYTKEYMQSSNVEPKCLIKVATKR